MSFINDIEIKNFKSICHQKIEGCKRINVFVGPPNVGKSNILEALSIFSPNSSSLLFGDFVRMGKHTTLFFNGYIDDNIEIIINEYFRAKLKYTDSGNISTVFELDRFGEGFQAIDYQIKKADGLSISDIQDKFYKTGDFLVTGTDQKISNFTGTSDLRIFEEGLTNDLLKVNIKKNIPLLKYEFRKNINYDSKYARSLNQPYGNNIFEIISTKSELHNSIISILKSYGLKFLYDSELQEYKILKFNDNKIFTVPYFMIADTLQRLIFYKAAIISNQNSILLFEEPEANCYEPYIMEITNAIKNDENQNQFFIVTHSQYVIDELMRDEESRKDTNIYLVGLENSETKVKLLSEDESKNAYQTGLNLFFNYQTLWDEN